MILLAACSPEGDIAPPPPPYAETDAVLTAGDDGTVEVPIEVTVDDDALMLVGARDGDGFLNVASLTDPEGDVVLLAEDVWGADERLTHAPFLTSRVTALNWPIRAEDGPLTPGTWTATIGLWTADDDPDAGADVRVRTVVRRTPAQAVLPVWILFAGGIETDEHLQIEAATERAVARWRALYAAAGITLDVHQGTTDADVFLGPANQADWTADVEDLDPRGVVVVIGGVIEDPNFPFLVNGECPSNPGPFVTTPISAVEIAGAVLARDDGVFQDEEIETFATTLAHEVGHYLGLFHAVQLVDHSGDPPTAWDALADTPACATYDDCVATLGDNVMFPFPICGPVKCTSGTVFTADQAAVMRGWVGVR